MRLVRGARDAEIRYDEDPVEVASRWVREGARFLHVIDLGAALGGADSLQTVRAIARSAGVPVQFGGGIRDAGRLAAVLESGVSRAILGTRALRDPGFLEEAIRRHGADRVMAALDFEGDALKISGWEETASLGLAEAVDLVERAGVRRVLVTATDRDGTLSGPRVELVKRVLEAGPMRVIAAGGIGSLEDVRAILELRHPRLEGIVVGRALYEGKISLREAIRCAEEFRIEEEPT